MSSVAWDLLATPQTAEDSAWELFHENSRLTPFDRAMPDSTALACMAQMPESLIFEGYPEVTLPEPALPKVPLWDALARETVTAELEASSLSLDAVAALLFCAYGVVGGDVPEHERRRRSVHSAGSLFPLELFVHSARVAGLGPGIYHYYPPGNSLRLLRKGDHSQKLAAGFRDARSVQAAGLTIFIAAIPERSVFRYGDRGYRFTLLEAGAIVQNLNLAAAALDLHCANAEEFLDREIDDVLDFDGLSISTLYAVGIGKSSRTANSSGMKPSDESIKEIS
jgi:SagB-type dehydrogenase family enzyme